MEIVEIVVIANEIWLLKYKYFKSIRGNGKKSTGFRFSTKIRSRDFSPIFSNKMINIVSIM